MSARSLSAAYRWGVASRVVAALVGGYALASVFTVLLVLALPGPRANAVLAASLPSFAVYAGAVLWVFAAPTARAAWLGLLLPALACAGAWALLTLT